MTVRHLMDLQGARMMVCASMLMEHTSVSVLEISMAPTVKMEVSH